MSRAVLDLRQRAFVGAARTATLATIAPDGRPRLVPVCFVLSDPDDDFGRPVIHTPLDEKQKRSLDLRRLARVRDILERPEVTLLVHRWSEDWAHLAWVRISGGARLLEPDADHAREHAAALAALREKYPQYRDHALEERPMIRIAVERALGWGALD